MNRKIDKPVLEKPIVGGSKDVWGDILNVNIDNTEKFHTQLLSDLETKDAELARLERDKASKSDLPDLVHPIVDNYVESSVKPTINEYIDSTSKPAINSHVESKKQELNSYVDTTNKPELDKYTKAKEGELDTHTGKKKSELDAYEKAKEGQLDSHTNTKKEELNQHTVQKQGQLDEYTTAKKGELDSHTAEKKNELNTHEKAKEKELDNYVTTVNKPELDKYTNIKKEELNSHTKTKESEITQVTETKKQEITEHSSNELDKFNQGAKQETDKQIGRVVAEGDIQVQRVKDESNGVIPRIEKLERDKVSKSGDTIDGILYANRFFVKDGDMKGGVYYDSGESRITLNNTKGGAISFFDDGTTKITAKNLNTSSKETISAVNELNSKKADLTGSTFTGLVAVKKDTNGEAMVALNSKYGNGDIYSGGSAKGVGFKNRTSGKGLFLGDDGSVKLEANNLEGDIKNVIEAINNQQLPYRYISSSEDLNNVLKPGSYSYGSSTPNKPSDYGQILCFVSDGKEQDNYQNWLTQIALSTQLEIFFRNKTNERDFTEWVKLLHTGNTKPIGAYTNIIIPSTSLANPAEYISNTTWTRIGEQNVGGTTVYYWERNS